MREFWVGGYASNGAPGIQRMLWDPVAQTLTSRVSSSALVNPSFLAVRRDRGFLYAVSESESGQGALACLAVARDGGLSFVNQVPSGGQGPCHLALSPAEDALVVANYGTGSVAVFALDPGGPVKPLASLVQLEGSGPVHGRQAGPHAHQVVFAGTDTVLVCDLGSDRINRFHWSADALALTPADPPTLGLLPGAGPRHVCIHPDLGLLFVADELDSSMTVFDRAGRMIQVLATSRGDGAGVNYPAHIALTPDARFVLVSNRGDDNLAVFGVDDESATVKHVGYAPAGGAWPRHFAILDADGRGGLPWHIVVACQKSGNVSVLPLDPVTGLPGPVLARAVAYAPACILPT